MPERPTAFEGVNGDDATRMPGGQSPMDQAEHVQREREQLAQVIGRLLARAWLRERGLAGSVQYSKRSKSRNSTPSDGSAQADHGF